MFTAKDNEWRFAWCLQNAIVGFPVVSTVLGLLAIPLAGASLCMTVIVMVPTDLKKWQSRLDWWAKTTFGLVLDACFLTVPFVFYYVLSQEKK
jgi:hypothetical protein